MDIVVACKLTSLEEDSLTYNCTTIFTEHGDTYIIDTQYAEFQKMFVDYHEQPTLILSPPPKEEKGGEDLNF
jgi:anthranilate/para-aminobenzoate synthase component II